MNKTYLEGSEVTLRVSVTDRCNLRCTYCLPENKDKFIPGYKNELLSFEEISKFVHILNNKVNNLAIKITGGEPLLRNNIDHLVNMFSVDGIKDISLTTNGQLFRHVAEQLNSAGLKRVNISLDTLDPVLFSKINRGGVLEKTLDGIDGALDTNLSPVKLNTVVIKGMNDTEVCTLAQYAISRGCEIRFIELMPIGESVSKHPLWFVPCQEIKKRLGYMFKFIEQLPTNRSPAKVFLVENRLTGLQGKIGFISPVTQPFCKGCNRFRLTSKGRLLVCLHQSYGLNIKKYLQESDWLNNLETAICNTMNNWKKSDHNNNYRHMVAVGG